MKKLKIGLCFAFLFFFNYSVFGQTPDPLPEDGDGQYLDGVPIDGSFYFVIAAISIGGIILYKKQKSRLACSEKK